ncbi:unnamed protein product [Ilex paraguariensis]|uniref:MHD1 domain-containing protein n=1 Tax=Ilex paraguariensis TaxID=185542 RepID=A0ABC8QTL8_9AQUA
MPLPPSSQAALIGACASLGWAFNNQAYTPSPIATFMSFHYRSYTFIASADVIYPLVFPLCKQSRRVFLIYAFAIETISGTVVLRWVNSQLGRILGWVERAIQQERWDPISPQQRHGSSIVEVYRIVEEVCILPFTIACVLAITLHPG